MDEFHQIVRRLGDWLQTAGDVPLIFADDTVTGSLHTPPQALLEVVQVRRGRIPLTVGDVSAVLEPGQIALVNAHYGNFGALAPGVVYACVSFDLGRVPGLVDLASAPLLLIRPIAADAALADAYHRLCTVFRSANSPTRGWRLTAEALGFLAHLAERCGTAADPAQPSDAGRQIRIALAALSRRQGDPRLTIAAIARELGLSHGHLCRLFQRRLGTSPGAWLTGVRLRRAAGLLARTDGLVKEIARQVGFRDALYFSRAFSAHHGCSPRAYRLRHRG